MEEIMKKVTKILAISLALVMCLALFAACDNSGTPSNSPAGTPTPASNTPTPAVSDKPLNPVETAAPDAKYREDITVIIDNNKIAVIDPCNTASSASTIGWAFNSFLNTLYDFDPNKPGEYLPSLATSYETTDSQHITFHLRDDVVFHNGEKMTAKDVGFTIDRAKATPGTNVFDRMDKIESYDIVDDYTITVNYKTVNVNFLADLSWSHCGILCQSALEKDPENGFTIGTGPWVIDTFVANDYVKFTRNENYWGELPKTKVLTFKYIAEEATRLTMLENKDVQAAFSINPNDFPYLEKSTDKFDTYSYVVNNVLYLSFNMTDPIMSDINFRKAVASALIRSDIILTGRNGYAVEPTSGTFWGYATEFKNTSIPLMPYDVDAAKAFLAESSYKGETVHIMAAIVDCVKMAEVIQQQLSAIGINVVIDQTDIAGLSAAAKFSENSTQMLCHTGTWLVNASSSRNYLYPGSSNNRASYTNKAMAELLDKAELTLDAKEREKIYYEVQEMEAEDMPFITLMNLRHVVGALKGVGGMRLNESSNHDLSYIYQVID